MGKNQSQPFGGAVVVKDGKIIAEGYHKQLGGPHAEVEAFNNAKEDVAGGTLYVNLEPCSITAGRRPVLKKLLMLG